MCRHWRYKEEVWTWGAWSKRKAGTLKWAQLSGSHVYPCEFAYSQHKRWSWDAWQKLTATRYKTNKDIYYLMRLKIFKKHEILWLPRQPSLQEIRSMREERERERNKSDGQWFISGILILHTIDLLRQITLHPVHVWIFSSIPGLYPVDVSRTHIPPPLPELREAKMSSDVFQHLLRNKITLINNRHFRLLKYLSDP